MLRAAAADVRRAGSAHSTLQPPRRCPGSATSSRPIDLSRCSPRPTRPPASRSRSSRREWDEATGHISQWDLPAALAEQAHDPVVTQETATSRARFRNAAQHPRSDVLHPLRLDRADGAARGGRGQWDGERLSRSGPARSVLSASAANSPWQFGIDGREHARHRARNRRRLRRQEHLSPRDRGGAPGEDGGRPVRVAYTRAEEMEWATFRPAALITIRSGFANDGTIARLGLPRGPHHHRPADDWPTRLRLRRTMPPIVQSRRLGRASPLRAGFVSLARRRREPLRPRVPHRRDRAASSAWTPSSSA